MLRVLSLFSGIGAFEKALERLDIEHEVLAYCEIDKYASKAYSIIHGILESKNLRDVTKVDILDVEDAVDLITYGFPCQDISACGRQKGFSDEEGNLTRSGLFFEALRIIDDYRPKFAIAENVKALTSKKFSEEFRIVLESLEEIGYINYYAVLNSKDYEIPQNRDRVFIISIRKDIDKGFTFPGAVPLTNRLKDYIEKGADQKYYISDKGLEYITNPKRLSKKYTQINGDVMNELSVIKLFNIYGHTGGNFAGNVYDINGLCPTLLTMSGGNRQPLILEEDVTLNTLKLRKLTPTECYKLMGFDAEDCGKVSEAGISDTQLYKQAGNSIVVNVLEAIFTELGKTYEEFRSAG